MNSRRLITCPSRLRQGVLPLQSSTLSPHGGCPLWAKSGFVQRSKKDSYFDDLIGAAEQRLWCSEAQSLGGLAADHQPVLGTDIPRIDSTSHSHVTRKW